jgi:transposase
MYNMQSGDMDKREMKGKQIAQMCQIVKKDANSWVVPSQSGHGSYKVMLYGTDYKCNCPDYELRQQPCKHVYAVISFNLKWFDRHGNETEITIKKKVYSQDWHNYNINQEQEKSKFMELLQDLCQEVSEPVYTFGRPKASIRDLLFASALKVYSQFSLRRFKTDLQVAKDKGLVEQIPSRSAMSNFMQSEALTPILSKLVQISSLPLRSVEDKFAVDSSGFRTTKFTEYCKEKHGTKQEHEWVKLHLITGVKTNIITAVEVNMGGDSPQFIPLVNATFDAGFIMNEVSADKAYSSVDNYNAVQAVNGQAYIPFKSNTSGTSSRSKGNRARLWRRMFLYYQLKQDEFMQHYHLRSNVETTFFMMKAKFGDLIRSKTERAQVNELLLKVLCHNIVVVGNEVKTI